MRIYYSGAERFRGPIVEKALETAHIMMSYVDLLTNGKRLSKIIHHRKGDTMRVVGFSGTRKGMTDRQRTSLRKVMSECFPLLTEFVHGDCVGADDEAANTVHHLKPRPKIIARPGSTGVVCAKNKHSDVTHPVKDFLDRNRDIVDTTDALVACPHSKRNRRSGTWQTINYAKKQRKKILIIWPDGTVDVLTPPSEKLI